MSSRISEMSKKEYTKYIFSHVAAGICSQIWMERRIRPTCSHCLKSWKEDYTALFEEMFNGKPRTLLSCSHCQTVWMPEDYDDLFQEYMGLYRKGPGNLPVLCARCDDGCQWGGKFWTLRVHLERECGKFNCMSGQLASACLLYTSDAADE